MQAKQTFNALMPPTNASMSCSRSGVRYGLMKISATSAPTGSDRPYIGQGTCVCASERQCAVQIPWRAQVKLARTDMNALASACFRLPVAA